MSWYEDQDQYVIEDGLGERTWPASLGLVQVIKSVDENGEAKVLTTNGWGAEKFWENHKAGKFRPEKYLRKFQYGRPFGIIMRSVPAICVDIDGKNGGIQASRILQLPPTQAEISKSANGFHLFYRVPEAEWIEGKGFAEYGDANGIIPGVDIRGTGIVYHYPKQRWNTLPMAPLPEGLRRLLDAHAESKLKSLEKSQVLHTGVEAAIHAHELVSDLENRRFQQGNRNQWLFAWGCRAQGYVPNWSDLLIRRADQIGLSMSEANQIVGSVLKYGNNR